ncbi:MAG: DUF4252 domain-containing protein [Tannerella sp.]|jgi:hypothetical protein|nr:DUF4252 domain-containing protein [Tannerella sp.]
MKAKYILIVLCLIGSKALFAQSKLFDKYADMDNVTSVYISKAMFQMMPKVTDAGLDLANLAGKMEGLQLVSTKKKDMIPRMRNEFTQLVNKEQQELMRVKDGNTRVTFYANMKNDLITELLMLADADSSFTVIQLLGKFTLKDIQEMKDFDFKYK